MDTKVYIFVVNMASILVIAFSQAGWEPATATSYGGPGGEKTLQGACGYDDLIKQGYGLANTALSSALYDNGSSCGSCYEIKCDNSPSCHPGSITVTATNFCPGGGDGWCDVPKKHFDLSQPMFLKIGEYKAGEIPVQYRRVPCAKSGGIKFEINGNHDFLLVLVFNVGGAGDVHEVSIKGSATGWMKMTRNYGQKWQNGTPLQGQTLSFQVTTSDGKMVQSDNVAPTNWQFGQSYEGKQF